MMSVISGHAEETRNGNGSAYINSKTTEVKNYPI